MQNPAPIQAHLVVFGEQRVVQERNRRPFETSGQYDDFCIDRLLQANVNRKLDDSTSAYLFGAIGSGFRVAFPEVGEDARRGQPDGVPTDVFTLSIPDMSEEFVVHDLYKG
jgi:hypothetical protein